MSNTPEAGATPEPDEVPVEVRAFFSRIGAKGGAERSKLSQKERSAIVVRAWKTRRRKQRRAAAE